MEEFVQEFEVLIARTVNVIEEQFLGFVRIVYLDYIT